MPKTDPEFKETLKRYRCERCLGDIREEVVRRTTNAHWHPRCNECGRPLTQVDRLDRWVRPREPKPKPPKPEIPGQMSLLSGPADTTCATVGGTL